MPASQIAAEWVFLICIATFGAIRLPFHRRARHVPVRFGKRDALDWIVRSAAVIGLGVLPVIYVIFKFPGFANYPFLQPFVFVGAAVFAPGLWIIYRSQQDLGRNFSGHLEIRHAHQLITRGIYKSIRHPMYLGFALWAIAQALLLPNWIAGPAGLVGWLVLFSVRVAREEDMMIQEFGDEYRAYAKRTARLLPHLF